MNGRALIVTVLCIAVSSCERRQEPIFGPIPPLPVFMAVAQRGANEVAIYPLSSYLDNPPASVISAAPAFTISAPGAESILPGLYVGEYPNTIAVFSGLHNGRGISFSPAGSITNGVNDPAAFAQWPFDGPPSLFVANRGANDIAVYKGLNNVPTGFNNTPALLISGLNAPNGLAFDSKGNLWVSQATNVVEFVPPFATNSVPATTITNSLQSPSAIAFDQTGTMYVADKGKNAILLYPAGSAIPSLTLTDGINGPASLLIREPYLYVANAAGNDVAEYRLPLTGSSQPFATNTVKMNQPSAMSLVQ